jgi:hypothetical protein
MPIEPKMALLSSKLPRRAKTVVCANRLKYEKLQTIDFNQTKWVDLVKLLFFPSEKDAEEAMLIGCD